MNATPLTLETSLASEIEQSIAARFEAQVARSAANVAVSDDRVTLTYDALNRLANRIAHGLVLDQPGRVVVCIETGAQCVAAIFGVLKAGHAYVPVDPAFPESRNAYIVEDAQASLIVTNDRNLAMAKQLARGAVRVINIDALPAGTPDHNPDLDIAPDALAWIIYTSGSTGKPKGVMQNQRNTLHGWMRRTRLQRVTSADRMTLFYSCSVMGSVYCIFGALLNGASLFPYDFREKGVDDLAGWLRSRRITIYHSVASVFRQFATNYQRSSEPFSIRLVIFGGERVLTSDVELARDVFSRDIEFYTGLGSTETGTIRYFHIGPKTELKGPVVPIGYPVEGMEIVLLDDDGKAAPAGEVGEITVRSRFLALGYWNNPEATQKALRAVAGDPALRAYHTGDMGDVSADGLLQHRGRKDFQVKIRGFRVEVGEVETALLETPAIKEAVVVAREVGSETHLVAYVVAAADGELSIRKLRQRLQKRVPYYMVPTIYVRLDTVPRTPNNKVDRLRLPEPTAENSLLSDLRVAPVDELETELLAVCSELLRAPDIGTNHNFFDLGGHSLSATQLVARVQKRFGVKLGMRQVFEAPDFKAIAELIRTAAPAAATQQQAGLAAVPRGGRLPVSFAQRRMWLIDSVNRSNSAYNISNTVRLEGALDVAALQRGLTEIVARHEVLRTRIPSDGAFPWQEVLPAAPVSLPQIDLRGRPLEEREPQALALAREMLQRHHDLAKGPLFECALIHLERDSAMLVLVFNHIIYDNIWSSGIFFRELGALYAAYSAGATGSPLAPLPYQFADYAAWEDSRVAQGDLQPHLDYWKRQLANLPSPLEVPGDHLRPDSPTLKGGQIAFQVPATLSSALGDFVRGESATSFMALLACWQLLLHRYTQQNDILIGTPTGRRYLAESEGMIGLFINNLVLRTDFSANPTFRELLAQVRHTTIDAFTHDELPFEDLVAALRPGRSTGVSPLFQHMFIHRNSTHSRWEIPGVKLSPVHLHPGGSKFDLTLSMLEEAAQLSGTLEYASDLFERETAERISRHFVALLGSALENPDRPVGQLELLTTQERQALRHQWNPASTAYPAARPHELIEQQAAAYPDAVAVVGEDYSLSYAELNRRANRLAARLRALGVGPDQLVAVCMDRSPELVVALLGVLKAGGAYVPLDPLFPAERLTYMIENAQARVCISQPGVIDRLTGIQAEVILLSPNDPSLTRGEARNLPVLGAPDDLAYVIYTSGSTGKPKGVQVTQRALVNFLCAMQKEPGIGRGDVLHSLTTICFDIAGLELFLPLISGASVVVKAQELALDPKAMLASMRATGATIMQATPVTWRMLLDHGWRGDPKIKVLIGGEAMSPELAEQLNATGCEVWNMYGPTETTIWSSVRQVKSRADAINLGLPIANTEFLILSPQQTLQPVGVPGELLIGGDGLARGYFRLEEMTREKFIAHPFESGKRLYRTGDLAVRRPSGEIHFLGRIDNQVKIRGFRIELGEIEARLEEHDSVKQAVVIAREDSPGDKRLVAYVLLEPAAAAEPAALREHASTRLPGYMVPSAFVILAEYPLTPNGKVDRKRLPAPTLENAQLGETLVAPADDLERDLLAICCDLLRVQDIGTNHNFFDIGGHSLSATQLVARLQQHFRAKIGIREIFEAADLKAIADHIRASGPGTATAENARLTAVPRGGHLPVSFAQRRMWLIDCLSSAGAAYNISNTVRLEGVLDVAALQRALSEIVARHEVLRTRFPSDDSGPWQEVLTAAPVSLPQIDLRSRPAQEREPQALALVREMLQRHHDLAKGPLFECALIHLDRDHAMLVLVFNHIIYDNIWSSGIFFRELGALYDAYAAGAAQSPLAPLAFQFADYAAWENNRVAQGDLQPHIDYWKKKLANLPSALQVPGDKLRPDTPSLKGGQVPVKVPLTLGAALGDFVRGESATSFMALLACWQLLLHRYTQQNDILVGTPTGRRYLAESEDMIGLFINNLVLRTDFSANPTFRELLAQVRQTTIDAFTHDELPFEDLVAAVRPDRSSGVAPLFQHLFLHRNQTQNKRELSGLKLTPVPMHVGGAKFDLTLLLVEEGQSIAGTLEYSSDLFERETAERMSRHFVALLDSALAHPDRPVGQLDLLTTEERDQLRNHWNPPATSYPNARTQELIQRWAAEQPEAVAVVGEDYSLTYGELNRRANSLAARLRSLGVGPDELVAVCLDRSPELVVALLAVLKAGGAYVPLDPMFPADRLTYMVENAQAKVCISQQSVIDRLPGIQADCILLDQKDPALRSGEFGNPPVLGDFDDLAYVIYTSGSTGKPKGVQVTQRGLVNFLHSMQREPGITRDDVLHSLTTVCFDIAGLEIFLPLISGARVVVKPQKLALDPLRLLASLEETGATLMQATPVTWRMLLDYGWRGDPKVKVLIGGEAMAPELAEQLIGTGCEVWNMYGPTETTIWSSVRQVKSRSDAINLGLPIANTEFLICSAQMGLQPVGVPGELLIGGDGLARGYFRLEEMTREKFIAHPFESGKRLYRTGDLAVRRPSGEIHFLGRIDNQVKIRGFRIELGEIETRLDEHAAVKHTVVIAREDTPGDKRLVAYLVLEQGAAVDPVTLREHARSKLPEYMIPSAFVVLSEFPQTPNGKVDRKQLPAPAEMPAEQAPGVAPSNGAGDSSIAEQVRVILESALKTRLPSFSANFFDLGGHSMAAITAVRAINQRFGLDLPPTALFDNPTAEEMIATISAARNGAEVKTSLEARKLSEKETRQVDQILQTVREVRVAANAASGMRESLVCKYLLAPVYVRSRRSVRALVKKLIMKLEGGSTFTVTLRKLFKRCHDIEIGEFTSCPFDADVLRSSTKIGKYCSIVRTALFRNADHPRNTIATHALFYHSKFGFSHGYELERAQIEVGNDVWIGEGAKILYPTRKIGDGAIVAAGAVVIEDVPPYAIVAGYPAQVVRYRFSRETIEKLLELRWWDKPFADLRTAREAFTKPLEGEKIR